MTNQPNEPHRDGSASIDPRAGRLQEADEKREAQRWGAKGSDEGEDTGAGQGDGWGAKGADPE